MVADAGSDLAGIGKLRRALKKEGAVLNVIAPFGGTLTSGDDSEVIERTFLTARSVEFDAVLVADGTTANPDIKIVILLQEAFRHLKAVGAWGTGADLLAASGIPGDSPGVVSGKTVGKAFNDRVDRRRRPASGVGPGRTRDGLRRPPSHRMITETVH